MTIAQAVAYFKKNADKTEENEIFFVTDDTIKLEGYIYLKI